LTRFFGSNTTLLLSLRSHQGGLADLEDRFVGCMEEKGHRREKTQITSFHKTKPTYLLGRFSIGLVITSSRYNKAL
jgi:hypothetical protein